MIPCLVYLRVGSEHGEGDWADSYLKRSDTDEVCYADEPESDVVGWASWVGVGMNKL